MLHKALFRGTFTALLLALSACPAPSRTLADLPNNIDISKANNGVVPLPETVDPAYLEIFDRYTKLVSPNGNAIHFLIQDQVNDEQAVRAREVMRFYLTDAPGTKYGADKRLVANAMAANKATLVFFNSESAAEAVFRGPLGDAAFFGQDLYATEAAVEGSQAYIDNSIRDATLEEVFHLVQGAGIKTALPKYQTELEAATRAAWNGGQEGVWTPSRGTYREWEREGSTSFEYIISVIDVYYGFWAHDPSGDGTSFFGEYQVHSRDAVMERDSLGVNAMRAFLPEYFGLRARIASAFSGTFTLTFDAAIPYTHKSQYLRNAILTGTNNSSLTGNTFDNQLQGNQGNNLLRGGDGKDTAVFSGQRDEYTLSSSADTVTVEDSIPNRDGTDTLSQIEFIQFSDQRVPVPGLE